MGRSLGTLTVADGRLGAAGAVDVVGGVVVVCSPSGTGGSDGVVAAGTETVADGSAGVVTDGTVTGPSGTDGVVSVGAETVAGGTETVAAGTVTGGSSDLTALVAVWTVDSACDVGGGASAGAGFGAEVSARGRTAVPFRVAGAAGSPPPGSAVGGAATAGAEAAVAACTGAVAAVVGACFGAAADVVTERAIGVTARAVVAAGVDDALTD